MLCIDTIYVIIFIVIDVQQYIDEHGKNPFKAWFDSLNGQAGSKVAAALERIAMGNTSNVKSVGDGVSEYRIDWGPGYRVYFGKDGELLVILIGGGTKKRQQSDIAAAKQKWSEYKRRKKQGEK